MVRLSPPWRVSRTSPVGIASSLAGSPAVRGFGHRSVRHQRVSLLHLQGVPWARIGEQVGDDDITTTSRVYTHVLTDERELDYGKVLV
jgi:hypothetical protein